MTFSFNAGVVLPPITKRPAGRPPTKRIKVDLTLLSIKLKKFTEIAMEYSHAFMNLLKQSEEENKENSIPRLTVLDYGILQKNRSNTK
ncbi:non-intrinsic ABC protein 12 [Prunus dulcis]|uniref:Non-intrinsic ABC protein 12 n=1 Tax=Prunus dulcis TaxID=3755 RepID=A0A5H2YG11_PRUDU|nr:non-intrinsic ABC protein 12 [Prunus dulcis]